MDESENDFLAGLLDFASLPDSNSNSNSNNNTPPLVPGPPFHCGFCLKAKYKNQSSIDSHIKNCAQWKNFQARFWREAGWTRAGLEAGFIFEDEYPVVRPERICKFCSKVFANPKEVQKHVSAARCVNALAIQDASPAVTSERWKCGFCGKQRCYTSDLALDNHIKICCARNNYTAKFWKEAGWTPDSKYGKGLDFKDGVATAKSERICQACWQCCKSSRGLARHLENGHCPGEPDEMDWKPPPTPTAETVDYLRQSGIVMPVFRRAGPPSLRTTEYHAPQVTSTIHLPRVGDDRPEADLMPSTQSGDAPPMVATHAALPSTGHVRPPASSTAAPQSISKKTNPTPSASKSAKQEKESPEIEFLLEVINTGPSPVITDLLINIARSDPESRAIPSAPIRPRQKRSREVEAAAALANRAKAARDRGIL